MDYIPLNFSLFLFVFIKESGSTIEKSTFSLSEYFNPTPSNIPSFNYHYKISFVDGYIWILFINVLHSCKSTYITSSLNYTY